MHPSTLLISSLAGISTAELLWDGRFNDLASAADLNAWSWATQTGPYQTYIHGNKTIDSYVELSADYKNPVDAVSRQGAKFTLDPTSYWNGQNMRRTELIPQTAAPINESKVFYHFSMLKKTENPPSDSRLHKLCFFENGFVS